jgi:protocatechuate 3,4-dioxygenase beta subunit
MEKRFAVLLAILISTLSVFGAITGTVMDRDGKPLSGAKVTLFAQESSEARFARLAARSARTPLVTGQTDAKGNFSIDLAKEHATAALSIEAAGYAPYARSVERDEEAGALAVAKSDAKQGRITASGKAVAGASVYWLSGAAESSSTTDAEGRYSAPDPARWAARLVIVHPDFAIHNEQGNAAAGSLTKSLDRSLVAGSALTGKVLTEDGKAPVAKAAIFIDEWPLATSGDDGTFRIAHAPAKWDVLEARTATLHGVKAKSDSGELTMRASKAASIGGTLKDVKSGVPIAGALVMLMRARGFAMGAGGVEARATLTDAKGNFALNAVAPGNYSLTTIHPGYATSSNALGVTAGQKVLRSLTASREARIIGTVVDEDKRPVAAARVSAASPQSSDFDLAMRMIRTAGSEGAFSGPDGRFVARAAGDADLIVTANKKGVPSGKAGPWFLAPGEKRTGVIVTLPRGFEVTGRVVDKDGKPISGVSIAATDSEPNAMSGMMVRRMVAGVRNQDEELVRTGRDGTFTLRVKEGAYDLEFKHEGYAPKSVRAVQVSAGSKPIDVTLETGVQVSGRVVRGGAGVEGVNVTAMAGAMTTTVTGPDGSFVVADLVPGQVMLNFSKFEESIREVRTVNAPARELTVELPPGGRITGRVLDKTTRRPIASFQAGVSNSRSGGGMVMMAPPSLRSFTSDDGSFTLENVPIGPVEVVAQAAGYVNGRTANINMDEAKTINDVEVLLDTGAKIIGKVTGPDGSPVQGASVGVEAAGGGGPMRLMGDAAGATTDASGEYTLETVESGSRTVSVRHQKYLPATKTVDVTGREVRVDVQLSGGIKVTGVVVTDAGAPVADATVRIAGGGGFGRSGRTDQNGAFTLESVAPGRYTVTARKQGYADGTLRDVDLSTGVPVKVTMSGGAAISGRISGLTAEDLAGVTVEARGSEGQASAAADSAGNYTIEGAPTGTVRVSAYTMRGFAGRKSSPTKTVQLEAGARQQVDIEFKSSTVIRGRISRNGKPAANAQISFLSKDPRVHTTASVTSDESGSYTVDGLEDAEYMVSVVDMQRMAPYRTTYNVRGSGNFDVDMKQTQLTGTVVDSSTGEPIDKARVQIRGAEPEMFFNQGAVTDPQGGFTVPSIAPGRYSATAEKDGYGSQAVDITVSESGQPVELKLARTSGLTLRVVDARNNQLIASSVVVTDMQDRVVHEDFFRFDSGTEPLRINVAQGRYNVRVSANGYAPRFLTLNAPGTETVGLTPGGTLLVLSKGSERVTARLIDGSGKSYYRSSFRPEGTFLLEPRGFENKFRNVAPGAYTLQVLGANGAVEGSTQVMVSEGGVTSVEI